MKASRTAIAAPTNIIEVWNNGGMQPPFAAARLNQFQSGSLFFVGVREHYALISRKDP
jgi:hypothetical protein